MIIRLDLVLALPLLVGATAPCTAKAQPVQKPLPEAAVQAAKETVKNGLGTQEQKDWLDATDIRQGNLGGEIAHWDGSEIWVDPDMVHSMVPPGLYGSAYEEAVAATLVPVIKHEIYHAPAGDSGLTGGGVGGKDGFGLPTCDHLGLQYWTSELACEDATQLNTSTPGGAAALKALCNLIQRSGCNYFKLYRTPREDT